MLRIFSSITNRVAQEHLLTKDRGDVLVLDTTSRQILNSFECNSDAEIRHSRSRGAGGMALVDRTLYVVVRSRVIGFDIDTGKEVYRFNPTGIQGYHGICSYENSLYISCMGSNHAQTCLGNSRLKLDLLTNETSWAETPYTFAPFGCFNAVAFSSIGEEYHLYSGPKEIYNHTQGRVVARLSKLQAPHDLHFINEEEVLVTCSCNRQLVLVNITTGATQAVFHPINYSDAKTAEHAQHGWLRGITSNSKFIFVTAAPSTLYVLDKNTYQPLDRIDYALETKVEGVEPAPFDLQLHPDDWE
jgi:hypothetical protein